MPAKPPPQGPGLVPKQFSSHDEMDRAITKLQRRIEQVTVLAANGLSYRSAERETAEADIHTSILEIFGPESPEFHRHQYYRIWKGPTVMGMSSTAVETAFAEGIPQAVGMLKGLIARLQEKRDDFRSTDAATAAEQPVARRVFFGHGQSQEWQRLRGFLVDRLGLEYEEFNRESAAGLPTAIRLGQMLDQSGFAFLVFTAEDEHVDGSLHGRENVIHEAGLFHGRHGFPRAIILLEDGCGEFSNIVGLTQIRFPPGDLLARAEEIRMVLEREGFL